MDELGNRGGTDRPDIGRAITHRFEDGLVPIICGLIAANPNRHLARLRAGRPPAHRRVEHVRALGRKDLMNFFHDGW